MFMKRRMLRIFAEDGNAVLIVLDHAGGGGVMPGLVHPAETIRKIVSGGADAILTSFGTAQRFQEEVKDRGLMLRLDGGATFYGNMARIRDIYGVNDALAIGADGVACMGFPGHTNEADILGYFSDIVRDALPWGMPVMAEMLPGDPKMCDGDLGRQIEAVARIGAELGADFIKTKYTGDPKSFHKVVEGCYVPILILGGEKMKTADALAMVKAAMDEGARGVAMGRNVWEHENPEGMVRALVQIIHKGADVDRAIKEVKDGRN
jgi:DhnA family fructose-bisphosphate aldolase class Ia